MPKPLAHLARSELVRFGIVGVASAVAYFVLSVGLDTVGVPSWFSVTGARVASIAVAYFGQQRFAFRVEVDHARTVTKFAVSRVLNYGLALAITYLVHDALGRPYWQASALVAVATPIMSWPVAKLWVFRT